MKNYRVGKMDSISVVGKDRLGHESFDAVRMDEHTEHIFGMFGGEKQKVTIEFPNNLAGVVIDRFGKDTAFIKTDADHFKIHVRNPEYLDAESGVIRTQNPELSGQRIRSYPDGSRTS